MFFFAMFCIAEIGSSFDEFAHFCSEKEVDLAFIGPEKYLAEGMVDMLAKHNVLCFGPSKAAAIIEVLF